MPYAFIDKRAKHVVDVRDAIPENVPDRLMSVELNTDENPKQGDRFVENETPRFKPATVIVRPKVWTSFQFLLRFTDAEREAFRAAALTDAKVADFMQLCGAASQVEAEHPMTIAGMGYLVSVNLLTQARSDEILGK